MNRPICSTLAAKLEALACTLSEAVAIVRPHMDAVTTSPINLGSRSLDHAGRALWGRFMFLFGCSPVQEECCIVVTLHRLEAPEVFCGTRSFARVSNRIAGG